MRFTKANCGQESQWPYTDCGPAVTGMFASCTGHESRVRDTNRDPRVLSHESRLMAAYGLHVVSGFESDIPKSTLCQIPKTRGRIKLNTVAQHSN